MVSSHELVATNVCRAGIDCFLDGKALLILGASVRTSDFGLFNHGTYCHICWYTLLIFGFFDRLSYNWDRTLLTGMFRPGRLGDKAP
ncbi:MAG TPA: hypothetical protein VK462_10025 [Nitrososphaeraceae archaeon]|nr:hypothetical protein [Nitrososphaeraceae archaeon]